MILIDTGPMVAMLNRNDKFHPWMLEQMAFAKPPLHTCESVISESCFRLHQAGLEVARVFELMDRRIILVSFDLQAEHSAVGRLMSKYSNLPMDLADACLVRMAEKDSRARVLTLDGDFIIYRKHTRELVPTIMPGEIRTRALRKTKQGREEA